jgi:allantoin racemase
MSRPIVLINPNTNAETTERMTVIAREAAGPGIEIRPLTARFGVPLITTLQEADVGRDAVVALVPAIPTECAGIIISAFADPGLAELRALLAVPIVGIAEAGLSEAGKGGRRFAVVTTTPGLVPAIDAKVGMLGLSAGYAGVFLTPGDPIALTNAPDALESALAEAVRSAIRTRAVEAVVIGGGPLAIAARNLAEQFPVPIIEPIPAAVRRLLGNPGR